MSAFVCFCFVLRYMISYSIIVQSMDDIAICRNILHFSPLSSSLVKPVCSIACHFLKFVLSDVF